VAVCRVQQTQVATPAAAAVTAACGRAAGLIVQQACCTSLGTPGMGGGELSAHQAGAVHGNGRQAGREQQQQGCYQQLLLLLLLGGSMFGRC
jgi:hypothetical protein